MSRSVRPYAFLSSSWGATLFLGGACGVLIWLWLPGIRNPVVSDTVFYARLGQSLWTEGGYTLDGIPYAKHLPFHAFLSYPLVAAFGMRMGMHTSSLLGGMGVLIMSFVLLRRLVSPSVGALTTLAILLHPGFLFMTVVGSADLLFTTLFLVVLFALSHEESPWWMLGTGVFAGLASITRYNGVPLFLLIPVCAYMRHRSLCRSPWLWGGLCLGGSILVLWLLRNFFVFGHPLFTTYTTELAAESDGPFRQFFANVWYYTLPHHNIFALFPFALVGLWYCGKRQSLLIAGMAAVWVLTSFWWVQAMRFAFPGYVPLLAFAILGLLFLIRRFPSWMVWVPIVSLVIIVQAASLCLYTYGACNAWFDRTVSFVPKNMGLSTEGFYTWNQARDFLNAHVPEESQVSVGVEIVWNTDIFRSDMHVKAEACPAYRITQRPEARDEILFATRDEPVTYATLQRCP